MFEQRIQVHKPVVGLRPAVTGGVTVGQWGPEDIASPLPQRRKLVRSYKALEEEFQVRSETAYRSGFEDGKRVGAQEAQDGVKSVVHALQRAASELSEHKKKAVKESDEMIVRLALMVAKTVLQGELSVDSAKVKRIVVEAIKMIEDRGKISIKVHPDDWEIIKDVEKDVLSSTHGVERLEVVEDAHVERGGCIVESDSGIFDAQLSTQLEEIGNRLLESV